MPVDLKNLNPAVRFHYPDDDGKEWIELRSMPLSEMRKLRSKAVTRKAEYYKGRRYDYEIIDEDMMFEALWDYQISGWYIFDSSGKEVQCNKKNKLLLMDNSREFFDFVTVSLDKIEASDQEKAEIEEKN